MNGKNNFLLHAKTNKHFGREIGINTYPPSLMKCFLSRVCVTIESPTWKKCAFSSNSVNSNEYSLTCIPLCLKTSCSFCVFKLNSCQAKQKQRPSVNAILRFIVKFNTLLSLSSANEMEISRGLEARKEIKRRTKDFRWYSFSLSFFCVYLSTGIAAVAVIKTGCVSAFRQTTERMKKQK